MNNFSFKIVFLFVYIFTTAILCAQIPAPGDAGIGSGVSVPLDSGLLTALVGLGTVVCSYLKSKKNKGKT